jgi:hypothetical protein
MMLFDNDYVLGETLAELTLLTWWLLFLDVTDPLPPGKITPMLSIFLWL